ncbi:FxLYD domain-containing protein [Dethiothermospora halolimnae]|uniref:FxLYD domain-containing protein n=1 Tax=Dethiothermospora halolimnae TaxID=3114390 RepID=UPI003CCB7E63
MKKLLILLLTVSLLLGIVGCSSDPEENITFDKVTIKQDKGMTKALGEVTNDNSKDYSFFYTITLYDKDENILGTLTGSEPKLKEGETKTFETSTNETFPKYESYKIQIDTIVKAY